MDTSNKSATKQKSRSSLLQFITAGFLAIYLNASLFAFGWILLDASTGTFNSLKWIGITLPTYPDYIILLKLIFYTAIGGAVGGVVFGMQNLWKHATADDFNIVYVGDYVFRPFGSAALAIVIYALIRGGVLTALGAEPTTGATSSISSFSAFAIGFLAGFGSYQVMLKLDELIKQIFGKASEGKPKTPPDEEKPEEANPAPSTPE